MHPVFSKDAATAIPLYAVTPESWTAMAEQLALVDFVRASGFEGGQGSLCLVPGRGAGIAAVLFGLGKKTASDADPFLAGKLPTLLPPGTYRFEGDWGDASQATLAFLLGSYRFERYKSKPKGVSVKLVPPAGVDAARLSKIAEAVFEGRDLINTPANDLGPAEIEAAIRDVAQQFGASVTSIIGDDLLAQNFPMVHAVGRASTRAPRLVDMVWGNPMHPKVTLVGKGVCFDTGGLDLKPASGMLNMKKDMGGAATMMAVAAMVMACKLPVRLRLLIPAVENSVSGNAFRPLDVVPTRKGITVEIGNTDAEGRLILCDALHEGAAEKPTMMVDCATLTGAARVALGTDLPALFCNDDTLADQLIAMGKDVTDPMWRMPLFRGYRRLLDSKVADINNAPGVAFGGAITAALYLQEFVPDDVPWAHFDMMAWNNTSRPGRPEGGEAQAARAIFATIEKRVKS